MPTTPVVPVQEWSQAFMTSLTGALVMFLAAIPKIIGFLVILLVGWFIASLLARALAAVLRAINFNDLSERSGFSGFVRRMGVNTDTSGVIAATTKWFVRLITLIVAFDALGLPAVSQVLQRLLLWLPNLVVAVVILIIAGLAARALASITRGATASAGFTNPDLLASLVASAVLAFGIIVAVNQVGIASTLVNTLFMGLVGAVALAAGLAFGLGGRDTAAEIVRNWYSGSGLTSGRVADAISDADEEAQEYARRQRPAA